MLVDNGANVNAVSKAGITPWLAASGLGDRFGGVLFNTETAALLVSSERIPNSENPVRRRPNVDRVHEEGCVIACACIVWGAVLSFETSRSFRLRRHRPVPRRPATPARELVTTYCISCHNQKLKTANLALDTADAEQVVNSAETWEKVIVQLRSRSMPPPRSRRPDSATYDAVAAWLETELDRAAAASPNPGRPASLHRLNRTEYANAIRDLLGIEIDGAAMLPPDEQAHGFDNIADALSVTPALQVRYLTAAAKISRLAVGDPTIPPGFERYTA